MNKNKVLRENRINKNSFFDLANKAIENLSDRSKEIIKKRFGLSKFEAKTLDRIGREYKITRERVRQILADSFRKICTGEKMGEEFNKVRDKILLEIAARSGIIKQSEALLKLSGGDLKEKNAIVFFMSCLKDVKTAEIEGIVEKSWIISENILEKIKETDRIARQFFEEKKTTVNKKDLVEKVSQKISGTSHKEIEDFLEALLVVSQNKFGRWGLSSWPEISPKSAKDKIYLVLKESEKPLHFSQIAKKIDEHGLSKKKAHPQTIHNELIKDSRFVLIGRGIYALAEWGYSKGTVKEVLEKILNEKGALSKENILQEISKARYVKETTVIINLNNSKLFSKEGDLYKINK